MYLLFVRAVEHRPELVHREPPTVPAIAYLREQDRTGAREFDRQGDNDQNRTEQEQTQRSANEVDGSLDQQSRTIHRRRDRQDRTRKRVLHLRLDSAVSEEAG